MDGDILIKVVYVDIDSDCNIFFKFYSIELILDL